MYYLLLGVGKTLSANMNSNVSPCENFYEFACGGFIQNKQIPSDQAEVTAFTMLRNKVSTQLKILFNEPLKSSEPKPFHLAKTLYKSCMNTGSLFGQFDINLSSSSQVQSLTTCFL
jgi:predicted metalloendopeptidase